MVSVWRGRVVVGVGVWIGSPAAALNWRETEDGNELRAEINSSRSIVQLWRRGWSVFYEQSSGRLTERASRAAATRSPAPCLLPARPAGRDRLP